MPRGIYEHKKGYKRPSFSEEWREKLSQAKKGKPTWNKGIKTGINQKLSMALKGKTAWNKGKHAESIKSYLQETINKKQIRVNRLILEKKVGRLLKVTEISHHVDGNRHNNEPDNLLLMRSVSAHMRLHGFARRHGIPIKRFNFEQPWLIANIKTISGVD